MAAKAPSRTAKLRATSATKWKIPGYDEPFVQDPLTFFEKNEFGALVARAIDDAAAGGADIEMVIRLIGMDEKQLKALAKGDFAGIDPMQLVQSLFGIVTRLLTATPELLEDLYLIALSIPPEKRNEVRVALRQIDDDTGFGILETFVEQNTTTIRDFIPRWRAVLASAATKMREEDATSQTLSA